MKHLPTPDEIDREARDCRAIWFVVMERARLSGDFELAARAKRELARLGLEIRFKPARERLPSSDTRPRGRGRAET